MGKFRREDEEEKDDEESQKSKPKIDLRDFVKQDFKGIVSSLDYFDEEKYEGGKRIKKTKKAKEVGTTVAEPSLQSTQEKLEDKQEDKAEESKDNKTLSGPSETSSKRKKSS